MVVAVGAGHCVEVHKCCAYEQHRAETCNQQFEGAAAEDSWGKNATDDLHDHGDQQAEDAQTHYAAQRLADVVAHAAAHH